MGEAKRRRKLGLPPRSSLRQRRVILDLSVPAYDDLADAHAEAIKEHGAKTPAALSDFLLVLLGIGLWGWRDREEQRRK